MYTAFTPVRPLPPLSQIACPDVTGKTNERIVQRKRARHAGSLSIVDKPQVVQTCMIRAFLFFVYILCNVVFLGRCACFVLFRFRLFAPIEAAALCSSSVLRYACTIPSLRTVCYYLKVAVNTIVPRSPFFLFVPQNPHCYTHEKNAVEYLRQ